MPVDFLSLFALLYDRGVRFVVVGGLASVLHGVNRTTADVDIVIDLIPDSVSAAISALTGSGYKSLAPVDPALLADPVARNAWQRDHHMQVFSLWDSLNRRPTIDILLAPAVAFDELWRGAAEMQIGGKPVKVASIAHLIVMKQHAGRPQDLADIERLRAIEQLHRNR